MKKFFYISFFILFGLSACKSLSGTAYKKTERISKEKLAREISAHRFNARTFDSRIRIVYSDGRQDMKGNGRIKILKDSIIWGSLNFLGIPMVKFYITPQKIRYYNKLDQTYYDGDFKWVSRRLGIPVDFYNLQNLLLGDLLLPVDYDAYRLKRKPAYYLLKASGNTPLPRIKITPFFKVWEETAQDDNQHQLSIEYARYQKAGTYDLPKIIRIKGNRQLFLEMEYKNPAVNKKLRFPFKIPSGYTPLY